MMHNRYFITVVNHADPTAPDIRLDFPSRDAAREYFHANQETARGEGCELRFGSEPKTAPAALYTLSGVCARCQGAGSITTRYANLDGAVFPDEDTCPACHGSGRAPIAHDITAAKAS